MIEAAPDEKIRALYSPSRRQVACVLLQAAYGGDRRACQPHTGDWCIDHSDDFIMITAAAWQWESLAKLPHDLRPGPEDFR